MRLEQRLPGIQPFFVAGRDLSAPCRIRARRVSGGDLPRRLRTATQRRLDIAAGSGRLRSAARRLLTRRGRRPEDDLPFAKNPPDSLGDFLCSQARELARRPVGDWSDAGQLAASGPRSRHPEEVDLRVGRRAPEGGRIVWGVARGWR